ncbi:MAG TPA: type II secretion system protein N [Janthinobacterium sp.]|jgi:general secretion pathway protein C|nr:type II secretion system protein N [Janthinobacterium sp.]
MKRLPVYLSFLAVVALSASLAYWALQLFKAPPRQIAAVPLQAALEPSLDAAASLFGGQAATAAVSNYQLRGVVAAANGRGSAAILALDGKPAQALAVGKEVAPGVTVREIHPRYVLLSDGGVTKRVDLATDAPKMGTGAFVPPMPGMAPGVNSNPLPTPVPVMQAQAMPVQAVPAEGGPPPPAASATGSSGPGSRMHSGLRMPTVPSEDAPPAATRSNAEGN